MAMQRNAKLEAALEAAKALDFGAAAELQEHVQRQIVDGTFDLEANLALLKLYQFFPANTNIDVVQKVLLKALLELPTTAFLLCTYLIAERFHDDPRIAPILTLNQLLEECRFKEFWASKELGEVPKVAGFEQSVRGFAYECLAISHQRCTEAMVAEALNISGPALATFLKGKGAELKDGTVQFPTCDHNQQRTQEVQSSIQVGYVARIF